MASASTPTTAPTTICVFCASTPGKDPVHLAAARSLAEAFAKHGIHLVYGAGTRGMMGELARTLVSLAGPDYVQGVIPTTLLQREADISTKPAETKGVGADGEIIAPQQAEKRDDATVVPEHLPHDPRYGKVPIYVKSMHERKAKMASLVKAGGPGSGFIALSGGYGTAEEILEMITWNELSLHDRGLVFYNVKGFWDGFLAWIANAVGEEFIRKGNGSIAVEETTSEGCIEALKSYKNCEGRERLNWDQK